MIRPPILPHANFPLATTDDFICVPNGTPPGVLTTSNVVGASFAPPIAPPIVPPLMANTMTPTVTPIFPGSVAPISPIRPIGMVPPVMPVPPLPPASRLGTTVISPPLHPTIGITPPLSSSRLLLEAPALPMPMTPTGPVIAQSRSVISSTWCPECVCCYGFGNCCFCCPFPCCAMCAPVGINPCCDYCPLDQTCRACCGCRCYC